MRGEHIPIGCCSSQSLTQDPQITVVGNSKMDETKVLSFILVLNSFIVVLVVLIAGYGLVLLQSYFKKKGEDLATMEDVGGITHEIERTKVPYAMSLEDRKARHQLRLAAMDRRLQAHQEAFALWRELAFNVSTANEVIKSVRKCQCWWENNCLYLEPAVRQAFTQAFGAAFVLVHLWNAPVKDDSVRKQIEQTLSHIRQVGNIIIEAVQLPSITDAEQRVITDLDSYLSQRAKT